MTGVLQGTYRTTSPSLNPLILFSDCAAQNLSTFCKFINAAARQKRELTVFFSAYQPYGFDCIHHNSLTFQASQRDAGNDRQQCRIYSAL
jgi:hypothetical protein